ncbi:MAG: exosome complex exonuclease Rrp41 [Candidatus Brockarchaeota archaeon]|nr:exosome complex exonuclease Rrp41 [Candidatus Brockarchaeota archaeon]MBO3808370.1 exosome complex exonuclease Rrp41 [Candidatus Brockarchaeota archaeon]
MGESIALFSEDGKRSDGRGLDELRPIRIKVGVLSNAQGSAYIEQGRNKILAAVYGPKEALPKHISLPDRCILRCRYHMAPFSTTERKSPAPSRREIELSMVLRNALEPLVMTWLFPRTVIDIFIEVLQADGGTRCAGLTAAVLALADAGIPLKGLVAACAVGKADGKILVDLNDLEDKYGEADMPVAYNPTLDGITLLQMDGIMSKEEVEQALSLAITATQKMHKMQVDALRERFSVQRREV